MFKVCSILWYDSMFIHSPREWFVHIIRNNFDNLIVIYIYGDKDPFLIIVNTHILRGCSIVVKVMWLVVVVVAVEVATAVAVAVVPVVMVVWGGGPLVMSRDSHISFPCQVLLLIEPTTGKLFSRPPQRAKYCFRKAWGEQMRRKCQTV